MINYNAALPAENYPASRAGVNVTDWIQGVKGNLSYLIPQVFRGGEQGFFYDPFDLKTQYQDATGTTAVNASGQPLGLMLDKSKGLAVGPELVDLSMWVARANTKVTAIGNKVRISAIANGAWGADLTFMSPPISGRRYQILFNLVKSNLSTNIYARFTTGVAKIYDAGTHTLVELSTGSTRAAIASTDGTAGEYIEVELSVVEVTGNHAYQTTSAARPIFRQKPILGSELVVNGDFSDGLNGWNNQQYLATATLVGGGVTLTPKTGEVNFRYATQFTTEIGQTYHVRGLLKVASGTPSVARVQLGAAATLNTSTIFTSSNLTTELQEVNTSFVATETSYWVGFAGTRVNTTDEVSLFLKSLSVKKITGYLTDQNYIEYDKIDDKLITNLPAQLTNCTVLRAIPNVGTQVKYNQTLPMLYEDSTNHAGLVAINRALTRKEQLRLMEELDKRAGATSLETLTFKTFDNNQEGFVYDPNDLSTMFQDAVGTVPVTAVGQPVGLILDKRKGSATGINLHTPTTPMNATTYPAIGTRSGLDITVSNEASGYAAVSLGMPTVVGKTYLLELIAPDVAGFWVLVSDSSVGDNTNRRTVISSAPASKINTKITFIFTASASVTYIHLNRGSSVTSPATFKDVSVKEVLGNHAYQTTSASRPILRQNAVTGANYLEFDGSDDFLQTAVPLSFPVTAVAPFDFKSNSLTKCILSAGNSGYLRSTETTASVFSSSGGSTVAKKKVDVLLHELTGDSVNIRSNSAAIAMRDTDSKNPYGPLQKYIGSFSDTHTTLRAAMDLYGMVVVRKLLSASEEAELRAHFNKRMGI